LHIKQGERETFLKKVSLAFFLKTYHKSFCPLFSKSGAVEGAEPSSRSAERETFSRRFFFISFFLCASCVKKAADKSCFA
jgi:hypothetical protein